MLTSRPTNYKQTDPRWKHEPYRVSGESSTIGGSGCGPTSVVDLLATFVDSKLTPKTECDWAVKNGYKAKGQGTYYSYIDKRLNMFHNFICKRLNVVNIHNKPQSDIHTIALRELKTLGKVLIACMGVGPWTSSGHYILVWGWNESNQTVLINDPASSKTSREVALFSIFKQTVKYYWSVTIKNYEQKGEETMDVNKISNEDAHSLLEKARSVLRNLKEPNTFIKEELEKAKKKGITDGTNPNDLCTRQEAAVMALRAFQNSNDKSTFLENEIEAARHFNISDGSRPKDYCTREEAMAMAVRALNEALYRFENR